MIRILIVDNKLSAQELIRQLAGNGYAVVAAHTGSEALSFVQKKRVDLVLLRMKLVDGDGVDLLRRLKAMNPHVEVVMIVGSASVDVAVQAIKLGAFDCLTMPIRYPDLARVIDEVDRTRCIREGKVFAGGSKSVSAVHEFVGESRAIQEVKQLISYAAPSNVPVLILGETGTGKELVARAIHGASDRPEGPIVTVNASSLPENLLESELFGHKRGAFTNAHSDKEGLLETAHGGTFVIDEVGDMDPAIQAKLLRVLETGVFRKLGDTREIRLDVRFVSATNKDLKEEVRTKMFRADLFYRLSAFIIHLPPLRERKEDIPLLVDYFLSRISKGRTRKYMSPEALDLLINFPWPGNVRELFNILERAFLLSFQDDQIGADKLSLDRLDRNDFIGPLSYQQSNSVLLEDVKRAHIEQILAATDGNKTQAASLLGISRHTLYRRLGYG